MAALTLQTANETGTEITFEAASGGGDTATWQAKGMLLIKNDSGGSITVTVSEQLSSNTVQTERYGNLTKSDATLAVGAGETGMIGPFKREAFRDSSGNINIGYSSATSVTVAWVTQ